MTELIKLSCRACGLAFVLAAMGGVALAGPGHAPEIDPGSMAGALTLLSGGVMLLTGRRRSK